MKLCALECQASRGAPNESKLHSAIGHKNSLDSLDSTFGHAGMLDYSLSDNKKEIPGMPHNRYLYKSIIHINTCDKQSSFIYCLASAPSACFLSPSLSTEFFECGSFSRALPPEKALDAASFTLSHADDTE